MIVKSVGKIDSLEMTMLKNLRKLETEQNIYLKERLG